MWHPGGGTHREGGPRHGTLSDAKDVKRAIRSPTGPSTRSGSASPTRPTPSMHGARIETHAEVTDVLVEDGDVVGVEVDHDVRAGQAKPRDNPERPRRSAPTRRQRDGRVGGTTRRHGRRRRRSSSVQGRHGRHEHPASRHRHQPLSTEGRRRHHRPPRERRRSSEPRTKRSRTPKTTPRKGGRST